jgi:hypothetical protein
MTVRITLLLALAAALVLVVAIPAGATQPRTITVAGQQISNDAGTPNDPSDDYADMIGSLVGKQYTTAMNGNYDPLTGTVIAWGTERFDGCLDRDRNRSCGTGDANGTLDLAFVYWAQYDTTTGALVFGQCVHPVTGGTGDFAGASGTLKMWDTPRRDGSVLTTYLGKLQLVAPAPAVRSLARRAPAAVGSGTQAPATGTVGCG